MSLPPLARQASRLPPLSAAPASPLLPDRRHGSARSEGSSRCSSVTSSPMRNHTRALADASPSTQAIAAAAAAERVMTPEPQQQSLSRGCRSPAPSSHPRARAHSFSHGEGAEASHLPTASSTGETYAVITRSQLAPEPPTAAAAAGSVVHSNDVDEDEFASDDDATLSDLDDNDDAEPDWSQPLAKVMAGAGRRGSVSRIPFSPPPVPKLDFQRMQPGVASIPSAQATNDTRKADAAQRRQARRGTVTRDQTPRENSLPVLLPSLSGCATTNNSSAAASPHIASRSLHSAASASSSPVRGMDPLRRSLLAAGVNVHRRTSIGGASSDCTSPEPFIPSFSLGPGLSPATSSAEIRSLAAAEVAQEDEVRSRGSSLLSRSRRCSISTLPALPALSEVGASALAAQDRPVQQQQQQQQTPQRHARRTDRISQSIDSEETAPAPAPDNASQSKLVRDSRAYLVEAAVASCNSSSSLSPALAPKTRASSRRNSLTAEFSCLPPPASEVKSRRSSLTADGSAAAASMAARRQSIHLAALLGDLGLDNVSEVLVTASQDNADGVPDAETLALACHAEAGRSSAAPAHARSLPPAHPSPQPQAALAAQLSPPSQAALDRAMYSQCATALLLPQRVLT